MADGPDLAINQNSKTRASGRTIETTTSGVSVPIVRLTSGADAPTVKLTPTVPIQILRVEDKSMSHHQLTDAHGRPMGVATPVPVNNSSGVSGVVGGGGGSARKKTGSSFQITSVTDGSRLSNDGGDDSADDLDESHTDDLSSEMGVDISKTDYDYSSEDAFSSIRDDPALLLQYSQQQQQPPALINSSGQKISLYTHNENSGDLATTNLDSTSSNVSVTVVESPATVPMSVVQNPEIQWHNRFRVVKIESSEPFRRGRWLCMDFLDPPPPSLPHGETGDKDSTTVSGFSSGGGGNGSDNSSEPNSLHHGDSVVIEHGSGVPTITTSSWSIDPNAQFGTAGGVPLQLNAGSATNQLSNMGVNCDHYPVSIILQTQQQGNLDFTNTALHMQGRSPQPQYVQQHPGYNVPPSTNNNNEYTTTSNVPSISNTANVTQDYPPLQSLQQQQIQQSVSSSQGPISGDSVQQPAVIAAQSLTQPSLLYSNPPVSNNEYSQHEYSQQQQNVQTNAIIPGQQQQAQQSQCYIQQVVAPMAGSVPIQETMNQTEMVNAISAVPTASSTSGISVSAQTGGTTAASSNAQNTAPGNVVSPSQETVEGGQQVVQQSGEEGETESLKALAAFLGEGHKLTGPAKASRAVSPVDDYVAFTSGKYSASGASTVAIDNKIEQAMDLVKSHLMFAVREEVDVLKEKITELMERINQLEFENSILKAAASPETLALLANSQTPNPPST